MLKNYNFHVKGTHCASCKILIEDILKEQDFIKNARVNLKKETVTIEIASDQSPEEIIAILNPKIKQNGYILSVNGFDRLTTGKTIQEKNSDHVIWQAIPIGLAFLVLFFLLQRSGILNFGIGDKTTPITSFIIGLIASVSSCLAIVGGLVLSLSAKIEQDEDDKIVKKPFILFHAGRLISFALLGGLLGLIGKAIGINFIFSAILGIIASVVMILLGLNLVGVLKKSKFTMPSHIFSFFRKVEHATWTPLLIGVGTFFLPCGFTQ